VRHAEQEPSVTVLALFLLVLVMHDHGMTMAGRFVTGNGVIAMGRRGGMSLGGRRREHEPAREPAKEPQQQRPEPRERTNA
jgi:hypothetical protein